MSRIFLNQAVPLPQFAPLGFRKIFHCDPEGLFPSASFPCFFLFVRFLVLLCFFFLFYFTPCVERWGHLVKRGGRVCGSMLPFSSAFGDLLTKRCGGCWSVSLTDRGTHPQAPCDLIHLSPSPSLVVIGFEVTGVGELSGLGSLLRI